MPAIVARGMMRRLAGVTATVCLAAAAAGVPVRIDVVEQLELTVSDPDSSARFYRLLGMAELAPEDAADRWFDAGHGLTVRLRTGMIERDARIRFTIATPDLESVLSNLLEHRIGWIDRDGNPNRMSYRGDGRRHVYLRDPDGYWLEIVDAQ